MLLSAQSVDTAVTPEEADSIDPEEELTAAPVPLYEIAAVSYTVDGLTRESLLETYMEIKEGKLFFSPQELEEYLADKQVLLLNQRSFAEGTVSIKRIVERPDGPDLVYLTVWAKDTWNVIVLPYAKYDSNEGLLVSLRGRDYNFLGSMQTFALNLDYRFTELEKHQFSLNGDFSIPFSLWGRDWVFDIYHNTEFEEDQALFFNLNTDLGHYVGLFGKRWKFNISNDLFINRSDSAGLIADPWYLTTGASFGGAIPLGLSVGKHPLCYSPSLSLTGSYVPADQISESRQGITGGFSHSLGWGRIDWDGNFRTGYTVSLSNSNSYDFYDEDPAFSLDAKFQGHLAWGWGGLNTRLSGFWKFDTAVTSDAGAPMRGIINDKITKDDENGDLEAGTYLSLDLPFNMWIWFMSRWFEGHLSPFLDLGFFRKTDGTAGYDTLWYSAGIEGFAFAKAARSLYLRVSFGFDLKEVIDTGANPWNVRELYIGLGHHY